VAPDESVFQLKKLIQSEFNIEPENMVLICNGKPLEVSDFATLKHAKIPNGSKLLVNDRVATSPIDLSMSGHSKQNAETNIVNDSVATSPIDLSKSGHSKQNAETNIIEKLEKIEKKTNDLEKSVANTRKDRRKIETEDVPLFHGNQSDELKKLKVRCMKNGELLMQLLESLDQITFSESQVEYKTKRKEVATKLNSVLDKNDKMIEKLSASLKTISQ